MDTESDDAIGFKVPFIAISMNEGLFRSRGIFSSKSLFGSKSVVLNVDLYRFCFFFKNETIRL